MQSEHALQLLDQAAEAVAQARYVIALTGAGMSVDSGIPPFRGPGGLWTKHGEPPMNGYQRFLADPATAWRERISPSGPMAELWETLRRARPTG
jgi:NAD-dependent deacetylase